MHEHHALSISGPLRNLALSLCPVAYHSHTDASDSRHRSTICVVGAPFLAVAEGRKVYWEITILEAQGIIRIGFAGSKMTFGKLKRCEHIGQGRKSWAISSDNGNGVHRCESLLRCSPLMYLS